MKSEVVILSCESYEEELVYSTLKKGIALLGGWETFLEKEEKILLKPNLVRKTEVERAVITHPAVVKGIVRLLQEEGYVHLSCGDSCGVGSAKKVMEGTGMDQMLEDYGVTIVDFNEGSTVSYPQGHTAKEFFLAKPVQETDALINLCKMKTHALERVTGGYLCKTADRPESADRPAVLCDGRDRGDGWERTDLRGSGEDECTAPRQ